MDRKTQIQSELESLLKDSRNEKAAREAIAYLFPKISDALKIPTGSFGNDRSYSKLRISNSAYSSNYFKLNPDKINWSKTEFKKALELGPAYAFDMLKGKIHLEPEEKRERIRSSFLEMIYSILMEISDADEAYKWFIALIDSAGIVFEVAPKRAQSMFTLDADQHLTMILSDLLKRQQPETRGRWVERATVEVSDVSMLCAAFTYMAGAKNSRPAEGIDPKAFGDQTESIRENLARRVALEADKDLIFSLCHPRNVLWFWDGAGHSADVLRYTNGVIEYDAGLKSLLELTIGLVRSTAGNYERVNRNTWAGIIDIDKLERKAGVAAADPSHIAKDAAQRFLEALKRYDGI